MYQIAASTAVPDLDKRTWRWPANYLALAEELAFRTDGRLQVQVMTPAELGFKGAEVHRALNDQLIEIAEIPWSWMTGEMPWLGICDLPYVNTDPYISQMKGTIALSPFVDEVSAEFNITNFYYGREHMMPYLVVYTKKPINKIEDLEGVKISIYNIYQEGMFQAAGAQPIFMPYAEVPMALAQGTIDGAFTSVGLATHLKAAEANVIYERGIYPSFLFITVGYSNKAFDALPADLKPIVQDVLSKWSDQNAAHTYNPLFADEHMQQDRDYGMTIEGMIPEISDPMEQYARETSWVKFLEDSGAKGEQVLRAVLESQGRTLD